MMDYLARGVATGAAEQADALGRALVDHDPVVDLDGDDLVIALRLGAPSPAQARHLTRLLISDALPDLSSAAVRVEGVEAIPALAVADETSAVGGAEHVWAVHLELAEPDPSDEVLDVLTDLLSTHHASVGVTDHRTLAIQLDVAGHDFVQVGLRALRAVSDAASQAGVVRRGLVQLEVLADVDELERRSELPAVMPELCSLGQAAAELGISEPAVKQQYTSQGRLGALKVGNAWVLPRVLVRQERARRDAAAAGRARAR